jgi:hypothetical protein
MRPHAHDCSAKLTATTLGTIDSGDDNLANQSIDDNEKRSFFP